MRLDRVPLMLIVACTALGAGCQPPDVGARCQLSWGTDPASPAPTPASISGDYLETGNLGCDSLVCIVSPGTTGEYSTCDGANCGYCSKPCVSDSECYKSETGLVCRQVVLDPDFIASLPPDVAATYLGGASFSRYCAVPLPPQ